MSPNQALGGFETMGTRGEIILVCLGLFFFFHPRTVAMAPDSTWGGLSLKELERFRSYYLQEIESLQAEKQALIARGIEEGEHLLVHPPDTSLLDDILIRLAELVYYQEKDAYLKDMEAYSALIDEGRLLPDSLPPEPKPSFARALAYYARILQEFPQSPLVDAALYYMGFLHEEVGNLDEAVATYRRLIASYPESPYVPEAYMRLGEYFFNPPRNEIEKAILCYRRVLEHSSRWRHDEALYKLGWCHYRLSQYPEAISYFTMLVEEKEAASFTADESSLHFREEALEYIALSFLDFGGPPQAAAYVERLGRPAWGFEMLEKMGDIYRKDKEEYRQAIVAYRLLLTFLQDHDRAPEIQKKIAQCYGTLREAEEAFQARDALFREYGPGSTWWKRRKNEKALLAAYRLSEEALRENVDWLLKEAASRDDRGLYEKAADEARRYLSVFPEDLHAYQIRWNLAVVLETKLRRDQEALQEYLTLSMVYQDESYQAFAREKGLHTIQDAATNAIVLADRLYKEEVGHTNATLTSEKDFFRIAVFDSIPLSPAAGWLALAYDNYIKLFPFDEKTPTVLAGAGALYYAYNQFDASLKYFKTLIRNFPQSPQAHTIQYAILEDYFGKRDFDSVEFLAKKILTGSFPPEIQRKAERRLAEALFLRAEGALREGRYEKAATEFLRVSLETPKVAFVDRALFNAAQAYEKLGRYPNAVQAYEQLRILAPGSPLHLTVLNNLALDYAEIGDFGRASARFLELADRSPDSLQVRDALYNAHLFAVKGRLWEEALRLGERYVDRYRNRSESAEIAFSLAAYADSAGKAERKRTYYRRFLVRYPESPRVVEAFYRLGREYLRLDSLDVVRSCFEQAHEVNLALRKKGIEGSDFYAAEALMTVHRIAWPELALMTPPSGSDRRKAKQRISALRESLLRRLRDVASYRTIRLPEALYRMGEVEEGCAAVWSAQSVQEADPSRRAVQEKALLEETAQILKGAYRAYAEAVSVLRPLSAAISDPNRPVDPADSVRLFNDLWLSRAEEKVSETLFRIAELSHRAVDLLLAVPLPSDLTDEARLEYQSQILTKALRPLLATAVDAHLRNLTISDSLGLDNPWTESSRRQVLHALTFLGRSLTRLALEALDYYQSLRLVYAEEVKGVNPNAESETPVAMATTIASAKVYILQGMEAFREGLLRLEKEVILQRIIPQYRDTVWAEARSFFDRLYDLYVQASIERIHADSLFSVDPTPFHEAVLTAWEDNADFLRDARIAVLDAALGLFDEGDDRRRKMAITLLQDDPARDPARLELSLDTLWVTVDTTWMGREERPLLAYSGEGDSGSSPPDFSSGTAKADEGLISKDIVLEGEPVQAWWEPDSQDAVFYLNGHRVGLSNPKKRAASWMLRRGVNRIAFRIRNPEPVPPAGRIGIQYVVDRVR